MRFLCRIGFHSWGNYPGKAYPRRKCSCCPRVEFLGRGIGSDQWMEEPKELPPKKINPEEVLVEALRKEGFHPFQTNASSVLTIGATLNWPAKSEKEEMERVVRVVEGVAAQCNRTPSLSGPHMWTGGVFVALCGFKAKTSASS